MRHLMLRGDAASRWRGGGEPDVMVQMASLVLFSADVDRGRPVEINQPDHCGACAR
jgi:hypothetical protein